MNTFIDLALAGVQQLVPYQPGKPIEELQRELGISDIIKLASNENPLGPSPRALEAINSALPELSRYPDGGAYQLKTALAAKLNINSKQLILGNGSSEVLELVMRTFVSPEHEVVFSQHAFALYPILTQAVGAIAKIIPAKQFAHDLTAMRAAVSPRTRVVFIANPNNPTGSILDKVELQSFIASLPAHVLCVLDEAYYEFVNVSMRADTIHWPDLYPNLIITRTFSKAYGLAGLRIGYGVGHEDITDLLNRVRQPFNNNHLALVAAEAALSDESYLQQAIATNNTGMQQLLAAFDSLALNYLPSQGNFIAVDVMRSGLEVYQALLAKGVIVRPIANYDMPQHIRVSIGLEQENQRFISAITQVLAGV